MYRGVKRHARRMEQARHSVLFLTLLLPLYFGDVRAVAHSSLPPHRYSAQRLLGSSATSIATEKTEAATLGASAEDGGKRNEKQIAGEPLPSWLQIAGTLPLFSRSPHHAQRTRGQSPAPPSRNRVTNTAQARAPRSRGGPMRRQTGGFPYAHRRSPQPGGPVAAGPPFTRVPRAGMDAFEPFGPRVQQRLVAQAPLSPFARVPRPYSPAPRNYRGDPGGFGPFQLEDPDIDSLPHSEPLPHTRDGEPSTGARIDRANPPFLPPPLPYSPRALSAAAPTGLGSLPSASKNVDSHTPPAAKASKTLPEGTKPPLPRPWVEPCACSSVRRSELRQGQRFLAAVVGGGSPQTASTVQKPLPARPEPRAAFPGNQLPDPRTMQPRMLPEAPQFPAQTPLHRQPHSAAQNWRAFLQISTPASAVPPSSLLSSGNQAISQSFDRLIPPKASYSVSAPDGSTRLFMRGMFLGSGTTGIVTELIEKTTGSTFAAKFFFREVALMDGAPPAALQAAHKRLKKEEAGNRLLRTKAGPVSDLWQKGLVASLGTYKLSARSGEGSQLLGTNLVDPQYDGLEGHQLMVVTDFLLFPLIGPSLASLSRNAFSENALKYLFHKLVTTVASLHQSGFVHGNIRASSIVIKRTTGEAALADFSVLMPSGSPLAEKANIHPTQCEPERVRTIFGLGTQLPASEALDSWNLGQLLFRLLCGFEKSAWDLGQVFAGFAAEMPWETATEQFYRQVIVGVKREKFDASCQALTGAKLQLMSMVKLLLDPVLEMRWTARKLVNEHNFFKVVEDA